MLLQHQIPKLALSVRQPWAWAIIHAGKNIENRSWRAPNPCLTFRGPTAIHASQGMTRDEYEDAAETIKRITGVPCPPPADLKRGGIIGAVIIDDIIRPNHQMKPEWLSPWFFGPIGLVLRRPEACDFIPAKGALGYFNWAPGPAEDVPSPARWMQPNSEEGPADPPQGVLL